VSQGTKTPFSPLIFGVVTAPMLAARRVPAQAWECDGLELRADGLPAEEVVSAAEAFAAESLSRGFRGLTIFTLRLRRDGGAWEDERARGRESVWLALARRAEPLCDFIDLEIEEISALSPAVVEALRIGKWKLLLSHHAFSPEDSSAWERILGAMRGRNPEAVKFAVAIPDARSTEALLRFSRRVAREFPVSCVIGMGEAGRCTRVLSPLLGCPITYAFLGEGPVAPGQLSMDALRSVFASAGAGEIALRSEMEGMEWAERRLQELSHAA